MRRWTSELGGTGVCTWRGIRVCGVAYGLLFAYLLLMIFGLLGHELLREACVMPTKWLHLRRNNY